MSRSRQPLVVRAALASFIVSAVAAASASAGGVNVDERLANYGSKDELSLALGATASLCQPIPGAATELCEWRLSNRDDAWRDLAAVLDTSYRVGVICAFDRESGAREVGSCTAHQRLSNRRGMSRNISLQKDRAKRKRELARRAELRKASLAKLQSTLQFDSFVRQVGEVPETCESGPVSVTCEWAATARTPGHGTIVAIFNGDMAKKARLLCVFPADGSDRTPNSCTAATGH